MREFWSLESVLPHDSCCRLAARLYSNAGFRLPQNLVGRRKRNGNLSMIPFLVDLSVPFHLHPSAILPSPTIARSLAEMLSPTGRPGSFTQPTLQAARQSRTVNRYTRTEPASMVIQMLERRVVISAPCLLTLSTQQTRATFNRHSHSQQRTTSGSSSRILGIVVLQGECNRIALILHARVHRLTLVIEARVLEASRENLLFECNLITGCLLTWIYQNLDTQLEANCVSREVPALAVHDQFYMEGQSDGYHRRSWCARWRTLQVR